MITREDAHIHAGDDFGFEHRYGLCHKDVIDRTVMGCAGLNEAADRASAVIRYGILKIEVRIIGQFLQGICRETAVEVSGHDRECAGSVFVQNAPQHFCLLCAHRRM